MVMELGVYLANKLDSFHSQDIYNLKPPFTVPEAFSSFYLGVENAPKTPAYTSGKLNLVCASSKGSVELKVI